MSLRFLIYIKGDKGEVVGRDCDGGGRWAKPPQNESKYYWILSVNEFVQTN